MAARTSVSEFCDANRIDELPTAPHVAAVALTVIGELKSDLGELEALVIRDPSLTLNVLRLANSTLFGVSSRISTIGHALARVDLHVAQVLVLSFHLSNRVYNGGFNHKRYWKSCALTAQAARKLGRHFPEVNIDEAEVAGLTCDFGELALAESLGDEYERVFRESIETKQPLEFIELRELGFTHIDLAGEMLKRWMFPQILCDAVINHSEIPKIEQLDRRSRELARVVYLAKLSAKLAMKEAESHRVLANELAANWAKLDPKHFDMFLHDLERDAQSVDLSLTSTTPSATELVAEARRMIVKVSLATASRLEHTTRRAEENQKQVEKLRQQADELVQQAATDPLTKIGNRKYFDMRLKEEIQRCGRNKTPLSLIMFDLDHFKRLNDTYGHSAGDEVLIAATRTIRQYLRTSDVLARYGGEEFMVIVPETDLQGAMASAERMRQCLESINVRADRHSLRFTASFGVTTIMEPGKLANNGQLIDSADKYLYEAKRSGRNRICGGSVEPETEMTFEEMTKAAITPFFDKTNQPEE